MKPLIFLAAVLCAITLALPAPLAETDDMIRNLLVLGDMDNSTETPPPATTTQRPIPMVADCWEAQRNPNYTSGVYNIKIDDSTRKNVYCDLDNGGGGWIAFQRRTDGSTDFNRMFADYMAGFGEAPADYWLGLDNLKKLISAGNTELRVEMWDCLNRQFYAAYESIAVGDAPAYNLMVGNYTGTAGDSLSSDQYGANFNQQGMPFVAMDSTVGQKICPRIYKGAFWFNKCGLASPNGIYYGEKCHFSAPFANGITWFSARPNELYSFQRIELKIRDPSQAPTTMTTTQAPTTPMGGSDQPTMGGTDAPTTIGPEQPTEAPTTTPPPN